MPTVQRVPATGVVLLVALLTIVQVTVGLGALGWTVGVLTSAAAATLLLSGLHRAGTTRFGAANVVTLARLTLGHAVAALVAAGFVGVDHRPLLLLMAVVALALDAVDGRVARRTRSVTPLGARFDMEADAFLILVLSAAAGPVVGWWVLTIGFARYALYLAERVWPWLRVPVPPRHWRKVVAAIQGVTLAIVVSGLLPTPEAVALVLGALVLLAESFGRDVLWLSRARHQAHTTTPPMTPTTPTIRMTTQLARSAGG